MLGLSGANADWAPECLSVVTALQPQPPGTQVGTVDTKLPSPLSKPSFTGVVLTTHAVGVAVGVIVGVGVLVAVFPLVGVFVGVGVPQMTPRPSVVAVVVAPVKPPAATSLVPASVPPTKDRATLRFGAD